MAYMQYIPWGISKLVEVKVVKAAYNPTTTKHYIVKLLIGI